MNRTPFSDKALSTQDIEDWLENRHSLESTLRSLCKDLIQKVLQDLSEYMKEEGLEFWKTSWRKPDEPKAISHVDYYKVLGER